MRSRHVVAAVLVLALLGGAASSVAYVTVAPAPPAGSSPQFVNSLLPFFSLFSFGPFSSGSVPISVSSPVNATSTSVSLVVYATTGTVSVAFSNSSAGTYRISGTMAKDSAPPRVSLAGSVLSISLPVGNLEVTLPASLRYTVRVVMATGTLNLDTTGAQVTQVNATLGTGMMVFDIDAGATRQATLVVSVGTLSGTIHPGASGVQVTASTNTGTATLHGSNLVAVNQAQGFQEARTSNFDSAPQKCIASLQVSVGAVSAEVG